MIIYSIKLNNFMGFQGEHFRKLVDKDVIGIIGEYKDNPVRSNQSGKSTVLEAILYCFFGLSRAKKDIELIHYGEELMWVEVVVIDDKKKKYTIKRGRDIKNNGLLEVDFQDKKTEGQEAINKLLGFDKKEFELTTYFKQSDIAQFFDLGSAEQKNHIIKWFNIEHWTKLEKQVKEDLSELNSELKTAKIKHDQLKESFDNDVDLDLEKETIELEMNQIKDKITKREKKLKELESQESMSGQEYAEAKNELSETEYELEEFHGREEKIAQLEELVKNNREAADILKDTIAKIKPKYSIQQATEKKTEAQQELKMVHTKLEAHEKNQGICPLIDEICSRIVLSTDQLAQLQKKRKDIPEFMNEMDKIIKQHKSIEVNESAVKAHQDKAQKYSDQIATLSKGLEVKIKTTKEKISKLKDKIKNYNPNLAEEKKSLRERLKLNRENLEARQRELGRVEEKIAAKKRNKEQVKVLSKQIKELSAKVDDLNYLAMMFGKNGIPSQEIENGFQQVEDDANTILNAMNTGMEIIFRPTRELDQKEPTCLVCGHVYEKGFRGSNCPQCQEVRRNKQKDEMNFQVTTTDNAYGFHMDSGGGKSLLATAIRMALTQLKRRMGKCNLNVIFLDEPDSALDPHNAEQFVKMVTNVLTKELGIAQVFWVSHNKDIQSSIPHVLKVIKSDGKASTKWA